MTTIRLHLDENLLSQLFPEGSEARIELTRSVTAELVKKLSIKATKHLDASMSTGITRMLEEHQDSVLKAMGIEKAGWGGYRLNEATAQLLRSQTHAAVAALITKDAEALLAEERAGMKVRAEKLLETTASRLLKENLDTLIDQRIKTMLKGLA